MSFLLATRRFIGELELLDLQIDRWVSAQTLPLVCADHSLGRCLQGSFDLQGESRVTFHKSISSC
jgi:hypothetical protein